MKSMKKLRVMLPLMAAVLLNGQTISELQNLADARNADA